MMNHETELKLQAYLDGELSVAEARAIAHLLERDAGAQALYQELSVAKSLVAGNEMERQISDSREFYWSKIQRQIDREEAVSKAEFRPPALARWWSRFLVPSGVLAGLLILVAVLLQSPDSGKSFLALEDSHEIETPLEETSSFSFRSEAAAMTVVWVDSHRE